MLVTADQLVCHAFGDYVLQSGWMANNKTRQSLAAAVHALTYALPFLFLGPSLAALAVIVSTHFVIDRWRLARFVVWIKERLGPRAGWSPWADSSVTGYPPAVPAWMAVWLLIIADNAMHVLINSAALRWL